MASSTDFNTHKYCLEPFLPEADYGVFLGSNAARWCKDMRISRNETVSCCLPCPAARWRYSEGLENLINQAAWSSIASLVLVVFILASYIFLPSRATGRHFILTSATTGFIFVSLAFIIPLRTEPDICHDDITTNDLHSDLRCAFTGGFILFGVWIILLSCFCGAILLHLTVCWEKSLGRKFTIFGLMGIYGGAAGLLALVLSVTGVSYQFGNTCVINPYRSKPSFWGPLLGVASATLVIELVTVGYCVSIILKSYYQDRRRARDLESMHSGSSPFDFGRRVSARAASTRVRRILQLQWRAIVVVCLVLFHVALLCGAFLQVADLYDAPLEDLISWVSCLTTKGSQEECKHLAAGHGPSQNFLVGAIILIEICPFWAFVVLVHRPMFIAWADLFMGRKPASREDFARRGAFFGGGSQKAINERDTSRISGSYTSPNPSDGVALSAVENHDSMGSAVPSSPERRYTVPSRSFSAPIPPRFPDEERPEQTRYGNYAYCSSNSRGEDF